MISRTVIHIWMAENSQQSVCKSVWDCYSVNSHYSMVFTDVLPQFLRLPQTFFSSFDYRHSNVLRVSVQIRLWFEIEILNHTWIVELSPPRNSELSQNLTDAWGSSKAPILVWISREHVRWCFELRWDSYDFFIGRTLFCADEKVIEHIFVGKTLARCR